MFTGTSSVMSSESSKNKKLEEWMNWSIMLLKSMEEALSVLFDGLETGENDGLTGVDKEHSLELQGDETVQNVGSIFVEHCQKLVSMISEPTNGPVQLPLGSVLSTVSRCLRVSYADVKSVPSMSELAGVLPALHRAALEILSQLLLSCRTNLLPRSRTIIDLCLQAVASARHMGLPEKSSTLASAYQALSLIVLMFGWGKYLTHQCKSITPELIADIKLQTSVKQASTITNQSKQESTQGRKKRGKKKNNRVESYSGLTKTNAAGEKSIDDAVTSNWEATFEALQLSQLILGRADFLSVENLMRGVLDTAQKIQHEDPPVGSPYTNIDCRQLLYSAVFACSTVKLNPGCSRKDSVTHFQMTNLALSLLNDGLLKDCCFEVQQMCRKSLNILLVTGNLDRPIIRRIQPDDNNDTKDPAELERDIEKVREENETLQARLLESEVENQTQKRLIARLKQEIETMKENRTETNIPCAEQKVYMTDPKDYRPLTDNGSSEDFCENKFEIDESDEEEEKQEKTDSARKVNIDAEDKHLCDQSKNESEANSTITNNQEDRHEKDSSQKSLDDITKSAKRKHPVESSKETPGKISKMDLSHNNNMTDDDSIQDMLADFVDAVPDTM